MINMNSGSSDTLLPLPDGRTPQPKPSPLEEQVLSPAAVAFLQALHRNFNSTRLELLQKRKERQARIDGGELPDFLPHTRHIREGDWQVTPVPADLQDRRVEITGPVDRKMIINALNSGARVFMADFEDSNTPSWQNCLQGQVNLSDAIGGNIAFTNPKNGKEYALNEQIATLMVRPRGWHLEERHFEVDGEPMSGGLFDFGLYFFRNAHKLAAKDSGPYFYLPKLESHLEARLWNDAFCFAQDYLGVSRGTIKATVLIETILASFEMHEILYELREHSAGLNCGRWDYIFSYIKKFNQHADRILPDRALVTMATPFMQAYSKLVIQTCHLRGAHAMGGMAAQIPIKNDEEANAKAIAKVEQDKLTEVLNGHDGTWVAHPGLVAVAMRIFDQHMPGPNQLDKQVAEPISAAQLIALPALSITEQGMRKNINVGILYIESWLRGHGAAAIYHLMEDAATAEISRTQVWQCLRYKAVLDDGRRCSTALYEVLLSDEIEKIKEYVGQEAFEQGRFKEAIGLFDRLVKAPALEDFLTLPAYALLQD